MILNCQMLITNLEQCGFSNALFVPVANGRFSNLNHIKLEGLWIWCLNEEANNVQKKKFFLITKSTITDVESSINILAESNIVKSFYRATCVFLIVIQEGSNHFH